MAKKRIHPKNSRKGFTKPMRGLADKVALVEKEMIRSDLPEFKAGDTVRVHVRIKEGDKERIQPYEGLVIAKGNHGAGRSFNVRKISHGVDVERIVLETSPKVAKLEVVQIGKVRRAKLYYIRGLEGKAAKIEKEIETQASIAARATAKAAAKAAKAPKA